ncbi:MAG: cytochrome c [Oligoflexales bacterium]
MYRSYILSIIAAGIINACIASPHSAIFQHYQHSMEGWHQPRAPEKKNPIESTKKSVAKGSGLFKNHCQACHGQSGEGNGPKAASLKKDPANLKVSRKKPDSYLFSQIYMGRGPMPQNKEILSEEYCWHIINYINQIP